MNFFSTAGAQVVVTIYGLFTPSIHTLHSTFYSVAQNAILPDHGALNMQLYI